MSPSTTDHPIRRSDIAVFDGDWTQAEQRLIASAINEAEASQRLLTDHRDDSRSIPGTRPWICYCKRLGFGAVYAAHRTVGERALAACAPVILGLDILMDGQDVEKDITPILL